jgi:hypothetical protein
MADARPPNMDLDGAADRLMRILAVQIDQHGRLLMCIEKKREAIRAADIDAMTKLCQTEHRIAQRLGDLEKQRLTLVGELTGCFAPDADEPMTLEAIAAAMGSPRRQALTEIAEKLRETIENVRHESSIVRAAADALNRHITGIMQTVNAALSRVGVYERKGRIATGSQMDFCVDIKS